MGSRYYYLGLDQGTTGTTALLLDESWNQIARGHVDIRQYYPKAGWVEHDPIEIYDSLLEAAVQALRSAGASAREVRCIGLDNQGETIVFWDKQSGDPVYPAIVWQDRRTAAEVDRLNRQYGPVFQKSTGLKLDSYFGASKIRWVLQHVPRAQELLAQHRLAAGTTDSWMIWKLTNGKEFVTDCVTASRTCLMNLERQEWDEQLLSILEIPREILPEIRENAGFFGKTSPETFLDAEIPITARPTGCPVGAGLLHTGQRENNLWDRMFYADEHREQTFPGSKRPAQHLGLGGTGKSELRSRRWNLHCRCRRTVASRWPGHHSICRSGGCYGAFSSGQWRNIVCSGLLRISSPLLGLLCPGDYYRHHRRSESGASGPSYA